MDQDIASTPPRSPAPGTHWQDPRTRTEGDGLESAEGKVHWPSGTVWAGRGARQQTLVPSLVRPSSAVNVGGKPPAL